MQQAIHIFKKDVRGLWYQIVLALIVSAVFAVLDIRTANLREPVPASDSVSLFLVVAWWFLIARLIQSEALAGDSQFWCTRPYAWKSLLAAKALFILAFVNLPMFVAQALILHAFGFSLLSELPGLIWSQVLLTTVFVLPMAVLAAVTTGLTQLLSFAFAIGLGFLALSTGGFGMGEWGAIDWIRSTFALALGIGVMAFVIFWQYERRRTKDSRWLILAGCVIVVLTYWLTPWTAGFGMQSRLAGAD